MLRSVSAFLGLSGAWHEDFFTTLKEAILADYGRGHGNAMSYGGRCSLLRAQHVQRGTRRAGTHLGSLPVARPAAEVNALAHHVEERLCCRHCAPFSAALCMNTQETE